MAESGHLDGLTAKRHWYHPIALVKRIVMIAFTGYVTICGFLYFRQTSMIYQGLTPAFSTEEATQEARVAGLVPWGGRTPGTTALQGYVRPDFSAPAPRGTIVFFHGNGESAWLWVHHVVPFTRRGFRVFLYEYPGYGGRVGVPSEKTIVPDARGLVRSLAEAGYGPIYLWGESLGSGVAAAVCADERLPIQGVTLVVPFDVLQNVAQSYYPYLPVRIFMTDKYDSISNLEHFHHPICVIRGDEDETIPPALTLNLFAHIPEPKKMIVMKGYGHLDWPLLFELRWWDEALDFIAPRSPAAGPG
jgi:pimeloyl-ACP methyl ester carboxylesterase